LSTYGKSVVLASSLRPSLALALFSAFGFQFLIAGVYKLVNDVAVFGGPLLLGAIINFVNDAEDPLWFAFPNLTLVWQAPQFCSPFSSLWPGMD